MRSGLIVCTLLLAGLECVAKDGGALPIRAHYRSEWQTNGGAQMTGARILEWHFERNPRSVEISDVANKRAERWQRDDNGRVWYARVFHPERKVLEYQPADLVLGGITDRWEQIQSVIDPQLLRKLTRTDEGKTVSGRHATVYRGLHEGSEIEIDWLDDLGVPVFVETRGKQGRTTLQLLDVEELSSETVNAQLPAAQTEGYEILEFSDLGDRERDPFVEKLMQHEGAWIGHAH